MSERYKLRRRESFAAFPAEVRADRLRRQTEGGHPAYEGLVRNNRVPWADRAEEKTDDSIWAVTCVFARAGCRRQGVGRALARAAVEFARDRGARAIESYPMTTKDALLEELHVGTEGMFAAAGFVEVTRPTLRRAVMRIDF